MLWLSELRMPDWLSILQITVAETYVWLSGLQITSAVTYIMLSGLWVHLLWLSATDYSTSTNTMAFRIADYSEHNICYGTQDCSYSGHNMG
jgi:hypothetical protein